MARTGSAVDAQDLHVVLGQLTQAQLQLLHARAQLQDGLLHALLFGTWLRREGRAPSGTVALRLQRVASDPSLPVRARAPFT